MVFQAEGDGWREGWEGGERGGCSVAEKRVKKGEGEGGEWKKRMVEEKRLRRDKQDGRREGGRERRERRRRGCGKGEGIEGKEEKREKWKVKKEQKCMYTRINKTMHYAQHTCRLYEGVLMYVDPVTYRSSALPLLARACSLNQSSLRAWKSNSVFSSTVEGGRGEGSKRGGRERE